MFIANARRFLPVATLGGELNKLNREFGRFLGRAPSSDASVPPFNIWSNDEGAVVTSELPGVKMEDIEITVSGNNLVVKASRKEEELENSRCVRRERRSGEFSRSFELPYQVDASRVEAKLASGVLQINLPRAEIDKPRKIAVSAN